MTTEAKRPPLTHRIAAALHRRPWLKVLLLLALPVIWLVGVYGGSLGALLVQSFYALDSFSGAIGDSLTLDSWRQLFTDANVAVMVRTVGMAAAVTVASVIVAFPLAYYMARYATSRSRRCWSWRSSSRCGRRTWSGCIPGS